MADELSDSELWKYLGLENPHQRNNVDCLMRAKAKASLADLQPLSKPALALIERHLLNLVLAEKTRLEVERSRVNAAWEKYVRGMNSLYDLIDELNDITGTEMED